MELIGYRKKSELTANQKRELGEPDFYYSFASNRNPAHFYSKRRKRRRTQEGEDLMTLEDAARRYSVHIKTFTKAAESIRLYKLDQSDKGWKPKQLISESKARALIANTPGLAQQHIEYLKHCDPMFRYYTATDEAQALLDERREKQREVQANRQRELAQRRALHKLVCSSEFNDLFLPQNENEYVAGRFAIRLHPKLSQQSRELVTSLLLDAGAVRTKSGKKNKNGNRKFPILLTRNPGKNAISSDAFETLSNFQALFSQRAIAS